MARVLAFFDLDITVRHFLHSGAFAALEAGHEVSYVFNVQSTARKGMYTDPGSLGLASWETVEIPRRRAGAWYWLFAVTSLRQRRGLVDYRAYRKLLVDMNGRWRIVLCELLGLPLLYSLFRALYVRKLGIFPAVAKVVWRHRPDVMVYPSTLAGPFMDELLQLSRREGIPLIVLMNSWDNPSAKAVATGHPDRLVVWGEQSRQYAIEFMRVPADRIVCFGAAQFQLYREPPPESLEEIRREFAVHGDRPVVLYAGAGASRYEWEYLLALERGIEEGRLPRCHVLYRPHPWRGRLVEGEQDFFSLTWKHVSMDPTMEDFYRREIREGSGRFFMADYRITRRLLTLVDAVISPLSTMLLEATVVGKPVLLYFPRREEGVVFSMDLMHFRDFIGGSGIRVCRDEAAFEDEVCRLLDQIRDEDVAEALRQKSRRFVVMDGPTYADRLAALVDEMTATRAGTSWT